MADGPDPVDRNARSSILTSQAVTSNCGGRCEDAAEQGSESLTTRPKIYLAGPDVFLPDAEKIGAIKRALCASYGFEGLFPLDSNPVEPVAGTNVSMTIFSANVSLMRAADAIIANLTPFRGPSADAGTVFEVGFGVASGKPVFGYSNEPGAYLDRARRSFGSSEIANADVEGMLIEDFGLEDNLMIVHALDLMGAPLVVPAERHSCHQQKWRDMVQFERCLAMVASHFGLTASRKMFGT